MDVMISGNRREDNGSIPLNLHEPLSPFEVSVRKASSLIRPGKRVFYHDKSKKNFILSHLTCENAILPMDHQTFEELGLSRN
jgi:hypothetical protein